MWLTLLTYQLATLLLAQGQNACIGHPTFKSPENSDIEVFCGSQSVELQILLCPIIFNGYNESLLSLNSQHSNPQCKGTADWTADPPVITQEAGTGVFADFSSVQYISISGMVCTKDPTTGAITYHQEMMYRFSCRYPLQYLVNNTHMSVSGVSLAVKDNNGSFISTLSMGLYADASYSLMLRIPPGGLELKTRIFVQVKASNLTNRCNRDVQTIMDVNGEQQEARFSFEAFRFIQHTEDTFSTYYVHCATRLCVNTYCPDLVQVSSRRRRNAENHDTTVSDMATITSAAITTRLGKGEKVHEFS
uniref:Zona pellucida-like domain-containing protein 1 n=1 Tax=Larimichthys crocea TaxID=215358 RepID=A0A0F8BLZ6_LARCR